MMWTKEFNDLNEVKEFLISQLSYDERSGFSFVGITSGFEFKEVADSLGEPDSINAESEQQQTLLYNAWVDHETEGKRDHHKLNVLFWFFHHKPLEVIRIHFDYYKTGGFAATFYQFIRELFTSMIDKFGEPEKKSLRRAKEEITYVRGNHTFWMWSNAEGLRIQIK
jgi:hypothetical protein